MKSTPDTEGPEWEIDRQLARLVGNDVRVAVDSFCPINGHDCAPRRWIPTTNLLLPDNASTACLPVLFEGRLIDFQRQIGVVHLRMETSPAPCRASEGIVRFRGHSAVVLHGHALLRMAFPFFIERLPATPDTYWQDFTWGGAQFELPLQESSPNGIQQLMLL